MKRDQRFWGLAMAAGYPVASVVLVCSALPLLAQTAIDTASAPRWTPCPAWVSNPPTRYEVSDEEGAVVFTAEGAGTELPWLLSLRDDEIAGDARYLLLCYRAEGLPETPGNYFVHGVEGTPGGRTYAYSDEVRSDGQWHVLAVDLAAVRPASATTAIALKVRVGPGGRARLAVSKIWFADELPEGARVARAEEPEDLRLTVDWAATGPPSPAPTWVPNPSRDFSATLEGSAVEFAVRGAGTAMRWTTALRTPVDLARLPYVSFRYRATGALGPTTYVLWLGDDPSGEAGQSCVPVFSWELRSDGTWRHQSVRVDQRFTATRLAIGLDCAGDEARMTLGPITFSSRPPTWPLRDMLVYDRATAPHPNGADGLSCLPGPMLGGKPSVFFRERLGISDWFPVPDVTVAGIPFRVPLGPDQLPQTGTAECSALRAELPAGVTEVYLLTAVAAPPTEPFGIYQHPRQVERLSEPEKAVCEIRYAEGPPDFVLPVDVTSGRWGLRRGVGVHVVHPDPARRATELLLHDRMQTASFAVPAVTVCTGPPRFSEPTWDHLAYPPPPRGALANLGQTPPSRPGLWRIASGKLCIGIALKAGPQLMELSAGDSPEALAIDPGALFEVEVGRKRLAPEEWLPVGEPGAFDTGRGVVWVLRHPGTGLRARFICAPGGGNELLLNLALTNESGQLLTATVRFPVLRGIRLGRVEDTWYLCGKRGGIIHFAPISVREPLGEPHPLQMDGFFNPKAGLALACLTHDTRAQHHYIRLAKTERGGEW